MTYGTNRNRPITSTQENLHFMAGFDVLQFIKMCIKMVILLWWFGPGHIRCLVRSDCTESLVTVIVLYG